MKKLFILLGIAILALTIINVSKIDTNVSSGKTLVSLITSARAESEGEGPCFERVMVYQWGWDNGPCDYDLTYMFECWNGIVSYFCDEGTEEYYSTPNCVGHYQYYLTTKYCPWGGKN